MSVGLTSRGVVTWRYLPGRRVKHALPITTSTFTGHRSTALCGTAPAWFMPADVDWYGTGTQAEHDEVERLSECRRCARLLAPIAEPALPQTTAGGAR